MKLRCAGNVGFRRGTPGGLWALALAACLTVSGCGGAAPETVAGSKSNPETPAVPPATLLAGAYTGTLYDKSFVSFVTNSAFPQINWYALYYFDTGFAAIIPVIYSGSAALGSSGVATVAAVREFGSFVPAAVRTGSGSITAASVQAYALSMSNLTAPNNQAMAPNTSAVVTSAGISGTWSGVWSDNINAASNPAASVQFDAALTATVNFGGCARTIRLTPATASASPYFAVSAEVPVQTSCPRTPGASAASLSGVAFVYPSPLVGKTRRLELMVVDSTGSGFSFRGDQ
ncbi:MAG: hypothetical protein NTY26_14415 [Burkholderiales bacterium]|nr:hypothetical protein [Burkholderiales bacterium]